MDQQIRSVDLGDEPGRFAKTLLDAGATTGAVEVRGAARVRGLADQVTAQTAAFFDLDETRKQSCASPTGFRNRGWNSYRDDDGAPNFERLSFARFDSAQSARDEGVPDQYRLLYQHLNVWPDGPLRPLVAQYRDAASELCRSLLAAAGEALGIPAERFSVQGAPHTNVSLTRYYPRPGAAGGRRDEDLSYVDHRDVSFATVLTESGDPHCLQVQDLDGGGWIDVEPGGDSVLVIFGTLAERVSAGALRACRHQVLSPVRAPRMSTAMFYCAGLENPVHTYDGSPSAFNDAPHVRTVGDIFAAFTERSLP